MSRRLARKLAHYRTLLVALANAAITWVILIIAPLGLFAVINCTLMVFLASLALGFMGDLALNALLHDLDPPRPHGFGDVQTSRPPIPGDSISDSDLWHRLAERQPSRPSLPRRNDDAE